MADVAHGLLEASCRNKDTAKEMLRTCGGVTSLHDAVRCNASVEVVRGRSPADTKALFAAFRDMVRTGDCPACAPALAEPLERLKPLSGVHEYPSRVKCATLAWHALNAALDGVQEASSE